MRAGSGAPTLVFVHGFACNHEDWRAQLEHFGGTNEVVACDLRGHGQTPGRPHECSIEHYGGDVAALVNNLELERCILVGHSMGCRVVLEAARVLAPAEGGKRVRGLVLIDGSRLASGDPDGAEAAARAAIDKVGYPGFAENLFRQMFLTPSAQADAIVERALRQSAQFGPVLWTRMARWDAGMMDAAFAAIRAPLLAIQSTTRDANLRRTALKAGESSPWTDYLKSKGARVEVIAGVGHFTMIEAADRVNRLVADFSKTV